MDILLTNDDGIYADGLWHLQAAFAGDYEVGVVAPDRERSAVGHAITLNLPIRKRMVTLPDGRDGIAVTGTPADCVKLGMLKICKPIPRLVISGINPGANVGVNLNYSGTVAAAREAALFGVSALSVSINSRMPVYYKEATRFVKQLADEILTQGEILSWGLKSGTFLNINVPDLPAAQIAGVRFLRHGTQFNGEYFEKRVDPRNRSYYWQGCDMQTKGDVNRDAGSAYPGSTYPDSAYPGSTYPDSTYPGSTYQGQDVDAVFLSQHYITITPVKCDTTDYDTLKRMQSWDLNATKTG